jgi:hypothetical protein
MFELTSTQLIIAMAAGLTSNQDWEDVAERMGEG